MDFKQELIRTINILIDEKLNAVSQSKEIATVVTGVSKDKYKVKINGQDYWVRDGVNVKPTVGTSVWIRSPTPNLADAYICSKR